MTLVEVEAQVRVKVWGAAACFTRPELRVERVSYDVMTPSAARGVLEAIYWKPEFHYEIRAIDVLRPIQRLWLRRNELKDRSRGPTNAEHNRAQRLTVALLDVAYVIHADLIAAPHEPHGARKHQAALERRLRRGQCFTRPFLGCREFSANFELPGVEDQPWPIDRALGTMLLDVRFEREERGPNLFRTHDVHGARPARGSARAVYFQAALQQGRMLVPAASYREVWDAR
ncbi:type I-C CRISPR-associated protein Cas5c [Deinococcus pimensis]|uniref:type I-C CRISPR-associated protein Cas5c n=1 Tax=Deinococcus pimensis TaxID=309888 RepID=UPI0004BC00D6|nr:type I-C CRISPR-associated protein Cas5c [Deinococcus pimensis]